MEQSAIDVMKKVRNMKYEISVELPGTPGESATGSVVINRSDFAMTELRHVVVGDDGTDQEQYSIDFSLQNTERFYKGPSAPMAKLFGSTHTNIWSKVSPAVVIKKNTTVYVELKNHYAAAGNTRTVQIWLYGQEAK